MPTIQVPAIDIVDNYPLTGKPALIVVDMLNDFVHPDGSLFVKEAPQTIKPIEELIRKVNQWEAPVFFVNDCHGDEDEEFKIWPKHAIEGTWGAKVIEPLEPRFGGTVITKMRYDPFYGTSLDHQLRIKGVDTLIIVGTVANICVLATAHSAALRWYNVVVPVDCISALEDFGYWTAAYQISRLYQGALVTTAQGIKKPTWSIEKAPGVDGKWYIFKAEWGSTRYLGQNGEVYTSAAYYPTKEAAKAVWDKHWHLPD